MSEWSKAKLKEVAKIVTGKTPSTSHKEYFGGEIPFVTPADLNNGILLETKTHLTHLGANQVYLVPENTVLVSCIGNLGKLAITSKDSCFNQQINGLIFNQDIILPRYGFYFAQTLQPQLDKASSSTTLPIVNKSRFSELEIQYPSLEEQHRIAAILDKADELRQKRQQVIEKLDELLQAAFIDMFGDPVSNPMNWDLVKVGDVINELIGGKNIECPDTYESKYKILKVSAVTSKIYKPDQSKYAPKHFEPNPLAIVEKGDLLFSRANTSDLVAATAYVWDTPDHMVLPDKLWKFAVSDETKVNKLYLWDLFKNTEFRYELSKLSSGTSGSMKNISKGKLNNLKMPLPPKELQDQFAEFSINLWAQIKSSKQSLNRLNELFVSLQNQAFNGTL